MNQHFKKSILSVLLLTVTVIVSASLFACSDKPIANLDYPEEMHMIIGFSSSTTDGLVSDEELTKEFIDALNVAKYEKETVSAASMPWMCPIALVYENEEYKRSDYEFYISEDGKYLMLTEDFQAYNDFLSNNLDDEKFKTARFDVYKIDGLDEELFERVYNDAYYAD